MTFSNGLIESILKNYIYVKAIYQDGKRQCGFDELVGGITSELNAIADTERRLHDLGSEEQMLQEEHRKAMYEIKVTRTEVISQCPHHSTTHHSDLSGGNDSSTTCDTCGKEVNGD